MKRAYFIVLVGILMGLLASRSYGGGPEETGKQWIQKTVKMRAAQKQKLEKALRARVEAYWAARVKGDLKQAYEFVYPPLRKVLDLERFVTERGNNTILAYEIESISADPQRKAALIFVKKSFRIKSGILPEIIERTLKQANYSYWVLYKGKWCLRYDLSLPGLIEVLHKKWPVPKIKKKGK